MRTQLEPGGLEFRCREFNITRFDSGQIASEVNNEQLRYFMIWIGWWYSFPQSRHSTRIIRAIKIVDFQPKWTVKYRTNKKPTAEQSSNDSMNINQYSGSSVLLLRMGYCTSGTGKKAAPLKFEPKLSEAHFGPFSRTSINANQRSWCRHIRVALNCVGTDAV